MCPILTRRWGDGQHRGHGTATSILGTPRPGQAGYTSGTPRAGWGGGVPTSSAEPTRTAFPLRLLGEEKLRSTGTPED